MVKRSTISVSFKKGGGLATSVLKTLTDHIPVSYVVNRAIDALPIELHLPGYNYCGPGTRLRERLARRDNGINKLDEACKEHDIAYSRFSDSDQRSIADKVLVEKAWQRVKSSDAGIGERAASLAVATAMSAKRAIGGGSRRRKRQTTRGVKQQSKRRRNGKRKYRNVRKRRQVNPKNGRGLYLRPYRNVY